MKDEKDNVSGYLEYIDKEMTIMGILSTFCIVSLGFGVDRIIFPGEKAVYHFWETTPLLCAFGFTGLLLAALCFYRQRALLAWYYGQISFYHAKNDNAEVIKYLDNSDSWNTWIYYQLGFGFLFFAISSFAWVFLSTVCPNINSNQLWYLIFTLVFWCIIYSFKVISYKTFSTNEEPEKELFRWIIKPKRKQRNGSN